MLLALAFISLSVPLVTLAQKDKDIRAPASDPILTAFSKVAAYDIYKDWVAVRSYYSLKNELTVAFMPSEGTGQRTTNTADPKWSIEVRFQRDTTKEPILVISHKELIAASRRATKLAPLGKIVEIASRHLKSEGRLSLPCLVYASRHTNNNTVNFTRLPEEVGGFTVVILSKDLKRVEVVPGH